METRFSKELRDAMSSARDAAPAKPHRLRVLANGQVFVLRQMEKDGFAVDLDTVPRLPGRVDVFDGSHHLFQCLIVATHEEAGMMWYDFKRATRVATAAALDFVKEPHTDGQRLPPPA